MPLYECNENQFVENIRRLLESSQKFLVNRKITLYDDARYGTSTLPEVEFKKYEPICYRKSLRSTVLARVPFYDDFHRRIYYKDEILHSSGSLLFPRFSIPYFRIEYSLNIWGSTYFFTFDALFSPAISLEKRRRSKREDADLMHVIRFSQPSEHVLDIKLPDGIMVFDVKDMTRVFDQSFQF